MDNFISVRCRARGYAGVPLQIVFLQELLQSPPIFARVLGCLGDVALICYQQLHEIHLFALLDSSDLGDANNPLPGLFVLYAYRGMPRCRAHATLMEPILSRDISAGKIGTAFALRGNVDGAVEAL